MDWSDGYVSDIDYTVSFFREQAPIHLSFACVLNGVEPLMPDRPFTYFELGSGVGLTSNILAASNPQGQFYAADFSPAQVVFSQQLAERAGLDNMVFLENSFAELAAGAVDLPQLDYITMYGVYSWVSEENRQYIVDFIRRYLKPGGVVFVNYNTMPGWAAATPLQWLMLQIADTATSRDNQVEHIRDFFSKMTAAGARYFNNAPHLQKRLDSINSDETGYLAHEYLNRGWSCVYHQDVAEHMAQAKLDYVGVAHLPSAFRQYVATPEQFAVLDTIASRPLRETALDFMGNISFREDIYVRGARRLSPARRDECLRQFGVALTSVRSTFRLELNVRTGKVTLDPVLYEPFLAALEERPHSMTELQHIPGLTGKTLGEIAEMAALLADAGHVAVYCLNSERESEAAALRMNLAIAQASLDSDQYKVLASPLLGTGLQSGLVQRLLYLMLDSDGNGGTALEMTEKAADVIMAQGKAFHVNGRTPQEKNEIVQELLPVVTAILAHRVPIWRNLKAL